MLGDTPYDVEAALRAGIPVVALRTGGWADADLDGAVAIYDDPADLLARFDGSILRCRSPASRARRLVPSPVRAVLHERRMANGVAEP